MSDLGNLSFSLGLKDVSQADLDRIRAIIEKNLDVKPNLNLKDLRAKLLNSKVNLGVADISIPKAVVDKANMRLSRLKGAMTLSRFQIDRNQLKAEIDKLLKGMPQTTVRVELTTGNSKAKLKELQSETKKINDLLKGIKKTAEYALNFSFIKGLVSQIYEIGGAFEMQHRALGAIIGSETKATELFGRLRNLALDSPRGFLELSGYAKQLAAFQVPYEELYDTTKRLADISSGLGVDMNRIILAYGQVKSASFLKGGELRQFSEAGIPLVKALADNLSRLEGRVVSLSDVYDRVSKKQISFDMVKDVLWGMTNEGGQFYNMQHELTDTLGGQLAKMKDAWKNTLYEISQSEGGLMRSTVENVTKIISNYETLSRVLKSLVATYGAYKAAMVSATVINGIAGAYKSLDAAIKSAAFSTKVLATGMKILRAVSSGTWIGLLLGGIAAIAAYMYIWCERTDEQRDSLKRLNDEEAQLKDNLEKENSRANKLMQTIGNVNVSVEERRKNLLELRKMYPGLLADYNSEAEALAKIHEIQEKVNNAQRLKADGMTKQRIEDKKTRLAEVRKQIEEEKEKLIKSAITEAAGERVRKDFERYENGEKVNILVTGRLKELYDEQKQILADIPNLEDQLSREDLDKYISSDEFRELSEGRLKQWVNALSTRRAKMVRTNMKYGIVSYPSGTAKVDLNTIDAYLQTINGILEDRNGEAHTGQKIHDDEVKRLKENVDDADKKLKDFYANKDKTYKTAVGLEEERKLKAAKKAAEDEYNEYVYEKKNAGGGGTKKDPIAEKYKAQIDLLKEAKTLYDSYEKLVGKHEAKKKVGENEELTERMKATFGQDFAFDVPSMDEKLTEIYGKLDKGKKQQAGVMKQIEQMWGKVSLEELKDNISLGLKEITNLMEEESRKWSLMKQIKELTGDTELAMTVVFGDTDRLKKGVETYAQSLENMLRQYATEAPLELMKLDEQGLRDRFGEAAKIVDTLLKELKKLYEEDLKRKEKLYTDSLSETMTYYEKLLKTTKDYEEKIAEARKRGDEKTAERLESKMRLEQTEAGVDVRTLLKAPVAMTLQKANAAATELKNGLLEAFKEGAIGADDFVEKMKQVDEAMKKARDISKNSAGGALLFGGFDGLKEYADEAMKAAAMAMEEARKNMAQADADYQKSSDDNDKAGMEAAMAARQEAEEQLKAADGAREQAENLGNAAMNAGILLRNVEMVLDEFRKLTSAMSDFGNSLDTYFKSIGSDRFEDTAFLYGQVDEMVGSIQGVVEKAKNGDFIGAGLSAVSSVFTLIANINKRRDEKIQKYIDQQALQTTELRDAYEALDDAIERGLGLLDKTKSGQKIFGQLSKYLEMAGSSQTDRWKLVEKASGNLGEYMQDKYRNKFGVGLGLIDIMSVQGRAQRRIDSEIYQSLKMLGVDKDTKGNVYTGQYVSLLEQRARAVEILRAEEDKKDSDPAKLEEYRQNIQELSSDIDNYFDDLANTLYGIDLQGWAEQIGETLVKAFSTGKDAAEAFDETVSDIMRDLGNNVITVGYIEPMFASLREKLFGKWDENYNRTGGLFTDAVIKGEEKIDMNAVTREVGNFFDEVKNSIPMLQDVYESMNTALGGILDQVESDSQTLGGQISQITESQADLLASYVNAMRADVSAMRKLEARLTDELLPGGNAVAQSQLEQLQQIASNTMRNAVAAEMILRRLEAVIDGRSRIYIN